MRALRWQWMLLAFAVGLGLALLYGWVISPVQYVDTTPDSLRADYRADYVLMVAEAYNADSDLPVAARRLAFLGDTPPAVLVSQAIDAAQANNLPAADQAALARLLNALQVWTPVVTREAP